MSKIRVGDTLPDFELVDEQGNPHRLSELQGDDVMVLLLGRGEHCPRERQHQREMLKFHEWCPVAFTQLVTVLPNDLHDVSKLKQARALWGHLLACGSCRRFRSQIRLIRSAVRMRAGLPAGTAPDGDTLSQEARHRIARAIDLTAGDDPDGADRSRD